MEFSEGKKFKRKGLTQAALVFYDSSTLHYEMLCTYPH